MIAALDCVVCFAAFGAFAVKLLELAELHKVPKIKRPDLKDWLYWIAFPIMPILGGGLAYVYISSDIVLSPILAFNVGASAPLIIRAAAQANPFQDSTVPTPNDA